MGCSSSTPVKEDAGKEDTAALPFQAGKEAPPSAQPHVNSQLASPAAPARLDQDLPSVAKDSKELKQNAKRSDSGSQNSMKAAGKQTEAASLKGQQLATRMNSAQSLSSRGGSLSMPFVLTPGWDPGKSVIFREDPRTHHIVNLACAVMKMPLSGLFTLEYGRYAVTGSEGNNPASYRLFLPEFTDWIFRTAGADAQMVVEDTTKDPRCLGQSWVHTGPKLRFVTAVRLEAITSQQLIGFLCSADVKTVPDAMTSTAMLANLANMATRELDSPMLSLHPFQTPAEHFVDHQLIPSATRYGMDICTWPKLLVDACNPKWNILHGPPSIQTFLGIAPGYLEGRTFWEFFMPLHPEDNDDEPWRQYSGQLEEGKSFTICALIFRPNRRAPEGAKILVRAEMRKLSPEMASLLDLDEPWSSDLWLMWLQPETQELLDPANAITSATQAPFPGVELGPIIGKGSFGYVRKGLMGKMMMAVKVIDAAMVFKIDENGMPLEASLGIKLRHPNIVLLIDYATHVSTGRANATNRSLFSDQGGSVRGSLGSASFNGASFKLTEFARASSKALPDNPDTLHEEPSQPDQAFQAELIGDGVSATPNSSSTDSQVKRHKDLEHGSAGSAISLSRRQSLVAFSEQNVDGVVEAWLLLEYCTHGSLLDAIQSKRFTTRPSRGEPQVSLDAVLATAYEIALAMRYLHSLNILHGDLTAGNVLLTASSPSCRDPRGFVAKVADFGLSRQALTSRVATKSCGTVTHMPPEVLNEGLISKQADVYAFGVLLVEMYCGERAYEGKRHPQILHLIAILKQHPQLPDSAPTFLIDLANACMHQEPNERPSFEQISAILRPHQVYIDYEPSSVNRGAA